MAVNPYIFFNGNCRKAVEFYAEVFETKVPEIMLYSDAPPDQDFPISEDTKNLVMHAYLDIKGSPVMFSDQPPGMPFIRGNNISLIINSNDMDEINTMFNKLKEGGTVDIELQETFWSKYYGSVTDKFGIAWQVYFQSE